MRNDFVVVEGDQCRIAKVRSLRLGYEDHGIFTSFIELDYGGSQQGAGGYDLRSGETAYRWLVGCLRAFGVDDWDAIVGRSVFAVIEDGLVRGFRPLPTEQGMSFKFSSIFEEKSK